MTQFRLATAAQILEAVRADAALTQDALVTLAQRTLREHPRRQSVDALAELTGQKRYADLPKGDHKAYSAWIADMRVLAAKLTGVDAPAKPAKTAKPAKQTAKSAGAKAPAKGKARAKAAPAKGAAPAGLDVDALMSVVTEAAAKAAQEVLVAYLNTLR